MERTLILILVVFVTSGVQAQLSYAVNGTVNITRTGCGTTKLCLETPTSCDPASNSTCLFASVIRNATSSEMYFQLSGNSTGYIALGLTQNASVGSTMLFICAQNTTAVFFFTTMTLNNTDDSLVSLNRTVTAIRGTVDSNNKIQCEFNVPGLNASSNSARSNPDSTYTVLLGSGTLSNGNIGPFKSTFNSGLLDLSNPATNLAATTASTNTTTGSGANRAFYSDAVLLLTSILTLTVLKTV